MLQYNDDIFFFKATIQNMFVLKSILKCFELVSKLKMNYLKSKIGGTHITTSLIYNYDEILNCDIMSIPFSYRDMMMERIIEKTRFGMG